MEGEGRVFLGCSAKHVGEISGCAECWCAGTIVDVRRQEAKRWMKNGLID
jgi:hypothetical protein